LPVEHARNYGTRHSSVSDARSVRPGTVRRKGARAAELLTHEHVTFSTEGVRFAR
jgi:hypothetical protein